MPGGGGGWLTLGGVWKRKKGERFFFFCKGDQFARKRRQPRGRRATRHRVLLLLCFVLVRQNAASVSYSCAELDRYRFHLRE